MAIYKVTGGYLILDKVDDEVEEIKIKLTKIAEGKEALPKNPDNVIKKEEDLQKIGERKGDPDNFLREK